MHKPTSIPKTGLILVLFACQAAAVAQERPTELKWGELDQIIRGHRVQLALPDGAVIQGEALVVREDALVLDVKKSSNKHAYPKGNAAIPRASVALIQLERKGRGAGRALGTTLGVISGVVLGGYVGAKTADSGGAFTATLLGVASAGTVGGYYGGKELDKKTTFIKVMP